MVAELNRVNEKIFLCGPERPVRFCFKNNWKKLLEFMGQLYKVLFLCLFSFSQQVQQIKLFPSQKEEKKQEKKITNDQDLANDHVVMRKKPPPPQNKK